jgi:hypothetical protein
VQLSNIGGVWSAATAAQATLAASIAATYNPLPFVQAAKLADASTMRELVERSGITTSGGIPLDTSEENQIRLLRLACSTEANPLPVNFWVKDRNGVFRSLSRAEARTLGSDINSFFQSCISGEANAAASIKAGSQTWQQVMAINLQSFFPANG